MCHETCDHEWGPVDELDRYHGAGEHTREERACLACSLAQTRVRISAAYAARTGKNWSAWEDFD